MGGGDISHMRTDAAIRIGARSRCYLAGFARVGEIYQVDMPNPDEIRLRRMTIKEPKKMTLKEARERVRRFKLEGLNWDELRKDTREID